MQRAGHAVELKQGMSLEEVQTLLKSFEDKIGDLADKKAKEVMEQ